MPADTAKAAYGNVTMTAIASVTQLLNVLSHDPPLTSLYPLNMEQSGHVSSCWMISIFLGTDVVGGSVDEWLACWTRAQYGPGSSHSHDAVGQQF